MIRIIAKLFAIAAVLTALLPIAPLAASPVTLTFVASAGSDNNACTPAQPCASLSRALDNVASGGQITCLDPTGSALGQIDFFLASFSLSIDCPGTIVPSGNLFGLAFIAANQVFKIRNLTFDGALASGGPAIQVTGSGTLILENCVFENLTGTVLDIEPSGPLNLVIRNSRISNGSTVAIVLKPSAGGSINATFDQVTVTNNGGGGIRLDTTNGPVTADVTDSVITNNAGNGLSAQGGAGGPAMLSIHNSVVAKNGAAGVNATGATGAALVHTTLLDSNASATSVASGARILTYGNNSIVGPAGSGFTGSASLQ